MRIDIRKEIVCHIIGNILAILIDDVRSKVTDWNELPVNQCVRIGYLTLLGVINHDISYLYGIP